jgi:hypothetical protein
MLVMAGQERLLQMEPVVQIPLSILLSQSVAVALEVSILLQVTVSRQEVEAEAGGCPE